MHSFYFSFKLANILWAIWLDSVCPFVRSIPYNMSSLLTACHVITFYHLLCQHLGCIYQKLLSMPGTSQ